MPQSFEQEMQVLEALGDEQLAQIVGGTGPDKPVASRILPTTRREDASRVGGLNTHAGKENKKVSLPFGLIGLANPPKELRTGEGSSSGQGPSTFKRYVPDLNKEVPGSLPEPPSLA